MICVGTTYLGADLPCLPARLPNMLLRLALVFTVVSTALAANHTLLTANRNAPASVHVLSFDDETLSLTLVGSGLADTTHTWLSLTVCFPHLPLSPVEQGGLTSRACSKTSPAS